MAERDRPHLIVPHPPSSEPFTLASAGGGSKERVFEGDRKAHGSALTAQYQKAVAKDAPEPMDQGTFVTFVSFPGLELALSSLDPRSKGEQPELVAVQDVASPQGVLQQATVYIPVGKKEYFLKRLAAYGDSVDRSKPRNATLVEGIQSIRRATIRELWTDPPELFPNDPNESTWWEVWLRKRGGQERKRLEAFAADHRLRVGSQYLGFAERTVALVKASADELSEALGIVDDVAELRRPHDAATFLSTLPASDQRDWVEDLAGRLRAASEGAPAVTILDTGVQDGHPLLAHSLDVTDLHVADATWQLRPRFPHGTEMAGLALHGDLQGALEGTHPIDLRHRLESVKLVPDAGGNDPELYGAITAVSVDRPEIQAAERRRVFMLAITAPRPSAESGQAGTSPDGEAGKPTSWSAAIDALAFGRAVDITEKGLAYLDRSETRKARLFVVSAGNIRELSAKDDHLDRSDLESIEDPGQGGVKSWKQPGRRRVAG